ncbi:sigma-54-dependent Fis family transcriptional regulator [Methylobacterium frigidaeris]|uniref:Acetoin catabolism regulatory protein n=1 Tax=Methylobacterium frigidaeris TaxID=2038277 RepID=A0AA37M435_9HYPH|nr:sigma-54-dependent Fis family transcriptional regulator [Methylobacterium frigidaeris]PIK72031.1 sigma-54-dependent Fis family transcriptional regulator [Methylobacterium frigidaeris]GJD61930.1 Acetoin catabolism regulatory protein [Methylobacterium frigidaeris]
MRSAVLAHIDELVRAASDGGARDPLINQSWRRCMAEYRLDPAAPRRAYIHTQARLREHRDALDDLIRVARFGVEALYRQVSGLGYVLILADARGVAVDFIGDSSRDGELRRAGLYRGSDWNEHLAGTCAVGTCIATGEALSVHLDDHFAGDHIGLTCTAAPVYAADGTLAAVLDISALQAPAPKASQHLALQLVTSFAHRIETASLHNGFRREWILHLSRSPEFADIEPDIALAVDAGGRILGLNSRARALIDRALHRPRGPSDLRHAGLGLRLDALFEASVDDLPLLTRAVPVERRVLRLRGGERFYALALEPAAPPARAARSSAPPPPPDFTDPALATMAGRAARLFAAGVSLLVGGETGTGKEFFAKAIHQDWALHRTSAGAAKPFVAVNCAALPETLIESELFGHEAGAFTGAAAKGKTGLVQQADGGTLFLDEIGDMPLAAQTRLLRVLAEREVTALGATTPQAVDIRVIAATHRDLAALVRDGRFREDLLYRLAGARFVLPPLRERADLPALIARRLVGRPGSPRLSAEAAAALARHSWPGNVRELVSVLDYACALAEEPEIGLSDLPPTVLAGSINDAPPEAAPAGDDALTAALRRRAWNVSAVARDLGLDRSTVHRRMRRLGLVSPNHAG